jgi:Protein of unknown function (DUF3108)
MKHFFAVFLFLFSVLLPSLGTAAAPANYTADYDVYRNGKLSGLATVKFTQQNSGRWELHSQTKGVGAIAIAGVEINERSTIRRNGEKPETLDYRFEQKVAWKSKTRTLQVNAATKQIKSTDKEKTYQLAYRDGVLDRHAIVVALMEDLKNNPSGDKYYHVADRESVEQQHYQVQSQTKLDTALGKLNAMKVIRIRTDDSGRETSMWFASDKQFVPLLIKQSESDGSAIEMRIKAIR